MSVHDLGTVRPGTTLRLTLGTYDSNDPSASATPTALVAADIEIYKDGNATQRASDAGYTVTTAFDSHVGITLISIDLADNTTAGFYAAGSMYNVVVGPFTLDGATTVNVDFATFIIGYPDAFLNTAITSITDQDTFVLDAGPAEDDALNGCMALIHDVASAVQLGWARVTDYTGSTRTVQLAAGPTFTLAATDNISFFKPALQPTTAGNALDVTATGAAGIDWGNVENPGTTLDLSATDINLVDTTTTNTDMRGTDNAALASVVGALTDAAAAGDPTTADTVMQYVKQLINVLVGTAGVATFPAEAAPANAVSLAEVIRAIHADVTGLNGDAMRGTDSALLAASAPTNFSDLSITVTTGRVDVASVAGTAQTANDNGADINNILVDTNELQTDWADGGRLDLILDARASQTTADAIETDTQNIQSRLPTALVGGRMDSDVGAMQADVISAAALSAAAAQEIRDEILPTQNAAFNNIQFLFVSSGDNVTPVTGAGTMAVTRSIDGGAFSSGTGTGPAEIGNGIYQYDASAADMNGGVITFRFTASSGTPAAPNDAFVTIVTGGGV